MLCLCCVPAIKALFLKRYIDPAVEGNGGVVGGGIEADVRHNVAIEAGTRGGIEAGAEQNVAVEASAGGGIGASARRPAELTGDKAVGVGQPTGVLEAALEL
ncbi:Hypothetical predicted protein [Prunus dulcis]|uniref:Uncharacterized protein n=1 Tax=Prunus dulcis TaxID=3755 RepID=A0A5E4GB56_PRUDU|nr:Hypothetical predicted protein [Prunus dulcis]